MSALDRVKRLIALTTSDNPNEARNAAQQACRIIREQGLEVVDPKAAPPPPPQPPPPRQQNAWPFGAQPFVDFSDFAHGPFSSDEFWRRAAERIRQNDRRATKEPEGEEWQCDSCHATIRAHESHYRHHGGKRVHVQCPDGRVCTPISTGWELVAP